MTISRADYDQIADYRLASKEDKHERFKEAWKETFGPIGKRAICVLGAVGNLISIPLNVVGNCLNTAKTAAKAAGSAFLWMATRKGSDLNSASRVWTQRYLCKTALKAGRIFSNIGIGVVSTAGFVGGIFVPKIAEKAIDLRYAHDKKYLEVQSRIENRYTAPSEDVFGD